MLAICYIVILTTLKLRVHSHSAPVIEDESIILHSLRKRDTAEQLGPIPYTQRGQEPQPITEHGQNSRDYVYDQTAVLNPNLGQDSSTNPGSSAGGGSSGSSYSRSTFYRQYQPDPSPASSRTYSSSRSQTYSSQSGSSQTYNNPSHTGNPAQDSPDESHSDSSGSESQSSGSGTRVTASYRPTRRRQDSGRVATRYEPSASGTRYYSSNTGSSGVVGSSGGTGPTGRRGQIAASYPLGPIISYRNNPQPTNTRQTQPASRQPQGQPTYSQGQPTYSQGQPTYAQGQPTYSQGQPTYTYSSRGQQQPFYTGRQQYTYTQGQPTYTGQGQGTGVGYVPYGYVPQTGQQYPYHPSTGACPETGIRMRINGMDCARAVDFYGSFLCYRHEYTSRECCEKCRPLKNPSRVGCEFGDHSYQCRQIQASDCYDRRNRQSCCETCERFLTGEVGCEYGDMTPRCERVRQNPSLCYIPENQRLCCNTCTNIRDSGSQQCPWGDQNDNLCRPFDQYGGVRINCYHEPIRRMCCQTCERLSARMPNNISGCQYGDRPVIFNTGQFGSLNCTSFFRHFPVEQCTVNQAVSINCCYTCHRYTRNG